MRWHLLGVLCHYPWRIRSVVAIMSAKHASRNAVPMAMRNIYLYTYRIYHICATNSAYPDYNQEYDECVRYMRWFSAVLDSMEKTKQFGDKAEVTAQWSISRVIVMLMVLIREGKCSSRFNRKRIGFEAHLCARVSWPNQCYSVASFPSK